MYTHWILYHPTHRAAYPIGCLLAVNSKFLRVRIYGDVHQLLRRFVQRVIAFAAFDVLLCGVLCGKNVNHPFKTDEAVASRFYAVFVAHGHYSSATIPPTRVAGLLRGANPKSKKTRTERPLIDLEGAWKV